MYVKSLLWILLLVSIQRVSPQEYEDNYYDDVLMNCSDTESIKGGFVTYSQGGLQDSMLTYHCSPGQYPFPVSYRLCGPWGEWSPMKLPSGRVALQAICKDVLCPGQLQLDNGDFWPREQWFRVGTTQSFSCREGFTLCGSAHRNCTSSGQWTGDTPVCDDHSGDCDDPGIPPGAQRSPGQFETGEKVTYQCQKGLALLGSAERVCLENREWSGSTPRCYGPYTFDSPSTVAAAMAGSLAGMMDVLSPDSKKQNVKSSFGRSFHVEDGSRMNIYILLDTSGSIKKEDFDEARNATVALIRKLDSYNVQLRFHVLSFASQSIDIVNITDTDISTSSEDVIWYLMNFDHKSHQRGTGTNLYSALYRVSEMINLFKQDAGKHHFNETQNIIIIETDGFHNTGKDPLWALAQIRHLVGYSNISHDHTDERLLDVYVFGVGREVKKDMLNSLASKKNGEKHFFVLKDFNTLGQVFNDIISDSSVTICGVAQEDITKEQIEGGVIAYTSPWHVTLKSPEWGKSKSCFGSIVSQNWVLTAAHCFARKSTGIVSGQLVVEHGGGTVKVNKVIMHPKYNIYTLQQRNVSEFYDYDIALVRLNNSIPLSWKARPICLPCTIPASRALKRINSTCEEHRKELLTHQEMPVFFIHKYKNQENEETRAVTFIHTESQRPACVEKARSILKQPTDVTLDEYVPDRFFCSGGTDKKKGTISCKGDSGGSLFLQKRKRYFQVGVLSWGIADVCKLSESASHSDFRDFHIDLFKIMPWLKQHLGEEIQFLPEINSLQASL
ncbi:complement C2 [Parambassis ranga]|uniref:C3/C5 convertase n=1 Tax=Parambassis ranga TaxID=210632 RepID=A0A6P7JEW3_9TELE|nr:complement C2-like [Parambassis ranga]